MALPKIAVGFYLPYTPPLAVIRNCLLFARLARLHSVFVADHFQDFWPTALWEPSFSPFALQNPSPHAVFDYQTLLGSLAARAGRVRLGVGVTEPIRRHPVLIAQAMLTLAHLSRRAPILGLGAGERMNTEPYGLDRTHSVDRLEETLQIIRQCFMGRGPIDFTGKHYHLQQAVMDLQAPEGRMPAIWVAARGPRMLRLVGTYGDGWFPWMIGSPAEYAAGLQTVRAAAREAGRDPDTITPSLVVNVAVAPGEDAARAMLETRLLRFQGLLLPADHWHAVGVEHPFGEHFRGYVDFVPEQYDRRTLDSALARVPAEVISRGVIAGTPDQVARQLRAYGEAGLRHIALILTSGALSQRDAIYALMATRKIARLLRGTG